MGSGNAIAIQNLSENSMMLLMVGLYTLATRAGASVNTTAVAFGLGMAASIACLWIYYRRAGARR